MIAEKWCKMRQIFALAGGSLNGPQAPGPRDRTRPPYIGRYGPRDAKQSNPLAEPAHSL